MQEQYLNSLKALNYANLSQDQENTLKDLEKQFNNAINQQVYFMVMEK